MREIIREPEGWKDLKKLIMRLQAATIENQVVPEVVEDSNGTLIVVKSVRDFHKVKDKELRERYLSRALSLHEWEKQQIEEAYGYRDDAVHHLKNKDWLSAVYALEKAAFHEEETGRPWACTFLPLLDELESLLSSAGIQLPVGKIRLNRIAAPYTPY